MKCQRCGSDRVISASAKCSDLCFVSYKGNKHDGYVPSDMGIGGGDYLEIELCLECGQSQGKFPILDVSLPDDLLGYAKQGD